MEAGVMGIDSTANRQLFLCYYHDHTVLSVRYCPGTYLGCYLSLMYTFWRYDLYGAWCIASVCDLWCEYTGFHGWQLQHILYQYDNFPRICDVLSGYADYAVFIIPIKMKWMAVLCGIDHL